ANSPSGLSSLRGSSSGFAHIPLNPTTRSSATCPTLSDDTGILQLDMVRTTRDDAAGRGGTGTLIGVHGTQEVRVAAQVDVLTAGYVGQRVASSVTLVRDGDVTVVVDPGMVASRDRILGPLRDLGV